MTKLYTSLQDLLTTSFMILDLVVSYKQLYFIT